MNKLLYNVPHEEYLAWPEQGQSSVKSILKSVKHYLAPFKPTQTMNLGTALHSAILTPDDGMTAIAPDCRRQGKANIAEHEAFEEANKGKNIITVAQKETLDLMLDSVEKAQDAQALLNLITDTEVSVKVKVDGLPMCARADGLTETAAVDIKSCKDASLRAFTRAIFDLGYHIQGAHYIDSFERDHFIIIAVENTSPYCVKVYRLSEEAIERGRQELKKAVGLVKKYNKDKLETSYGGQFEIETIEVPYYLKERE